MRGVSSEETRNKKTGRCVPLNAWRSLKTWVKIEGDAEHGIIAIYESLG